LHGSVVQRDGRIAASLFFGSVIAGANFAGIEQEVMIGDKPGIIPSIAGQAWLTGTHQHMLDPTDPYPHGYIVSDTWPRIGKD
jgi:proline racemase